MIQWFDGFGICKVFILCGLLETTFFRFPSIDGDERISAGDGVTMIKGIKADKNETKDELLK